ncbi:MAG: amidase [Solirubrobacteraceae bacterium]|nr:amidase [Solirubrobacteraceae bacterium]
MGALTSASATSLARLIARRDVTAREAVEARLRRIEAVDGEVNAVVQLDAERAYGGGIETDNPVHGRTSNPDDLARTPGGRSSRAPAACRSPACSTTKGSSGTLGDPRTQGGPLACSVDDVAGGCGSSPDPTATTVASPRSHWSIRATWTPAALRVAVRTDNGLGAPTPETVAAVATAAEALGAAGATMQEARHPDGGHELTIEVWRSYGEGVAAAELWRLLRRWDDFRSRMLAFAARFDVLLCPVFPSPARLHGTMNVAGELDPTSWTTPHSLTGWPAATVRAGTSAEGLPVDVQLVARPWRDDVALATALRVERELGAWAPPRGVRRDRPRPARRGTG